MNENAEAVVLAGGEGTRLRPLTKHQPKPMLPVANRPVLEYVLDALVDAGIKRAVVVVGHKGDRIRDRFENNYRGLELEYVRQKVQLGSGHALLQARDHVADEFVVVNGDNVIDAQMVAGTIDQFRNAECAACVAVAPSDTPEEYGAVLTEDGSVTTIVEHPADATGYRINAGVYVFTSEIMAALDRTETRSGELYVTDALVDLPGTVLAADVKGIWFDPSYPWDVLSVTEKLLSAHPELVDDEFDNRILIDPSAYVHETAVIEAPAVIGPDCEIGAGAVVRSGTCLGQNTRVGANTVIEHSIVASDARIGSSVVLRDCLIGSGTHVDDGVVAPGGRVDLLVNDTVHRDQRLGGIIADRAVVGANVTLRPGVRVGPGSKLDPGVTVDGQIADEVEVMA